jgi:hypothetical protein
MFLFMIGIIQELLRARPFVPFYVLTNGGNRYRVESADHADINPRGTQIVIWFDNESGVTLAGLHIVGVEKEASQTA